MICLSNHCFGKTAWMFLRTALYVMKTTLLVGRTALYVGITDTYVIKTPMLFCKSNDIAAKNRTCSLEKSLRRFIHGAYE